MTEPKLQHINTYEKGLAMHLVPFYDVCLDGADFHCPTYELDTPAELVNVDKLIKAYVEGSPRVPRCESCEHLTPSSTMEQLIYDHCAPHLSAAVLVQGA